MQIKMDYIQHIVNDEEDSPGGNLVYFEQKITGTTISQQL